MYLSEAQRSRLLGAAFAIVAEQGYRGMAVRAVAERAGVSSKTFYDLFEDREGCFLAAFEDGVEQLTALARPAYEAQRDWVESVRAGLAALLAFLDREPALCGLLLVEALGVGPRVLARRAEVLDRVARVVDGGREGAKDAGELPAMTAAGVVGAVCSMVHARLVERDIEPERDAEPLIGLLNELMATIVLPYRGREAAARELSRPAPELPAPAPEPEVESEAPAGLALPPLPDDYRLTVRRHAALAAVAELCAGGSEPCSREVRERAGIPYEGQLSHLMMDLEIRGLVENTRAGAVGTRKAWRITARGRAVLDANPPLKSAERPRRKGASVERPAPVRPVAAAKPERPTPPPGARGASRSRTQGAWRATHASEGGRRDAPPIAPLDFRLTVRTQMALQEIAKSSARGSYPSNLQVAQRIGISAKAAVSKMMSRLQGQGLIENTRGKDTKGIEKAWRLTAHGQAVLDAHRPVRVRRADDPAGVRGGKLVPKRGRRNPAPARPGSAALRLTVRTQLVLTAVAEHAGASSREIAEAAGVRDQGQISKLLARLAEQGLIHSTTRGGHGNPKAWRLTPRGEALLHANTPAHETQAA
jgi:AcrR family transcriptional regulator/DNA-binding MarR family transcriptional regulator